LEVKVKTTIKTKDFKKVIQAIKTTKAIEVKMIMPILACVKVTVTNDKTIFEAATLETRIKYEIDSTSNQKGECCLNFKELCDCVKNANDTVTIENDSVSTVLGQVKVSSCDPKEYPSHPLTSDAKFIYKGCLKWAMTTLKHSISTDETRYHLNGVCFDNQSLVSTDGHRLTRVSLDRGFGKRPFIIPKNIALASKFMSDQDEYELSDRHLVVHMSDFTLTIRLIDGNFPDYNRVIPDYYESQVHVSSDQLAIFNKAYKKVIKSHKTSKCTFNGSLKIEAYNSELDDYIGTTLETLNDLPSEVIAKFNSKYLSEVFSVLPNDSNTCVTFQVKDELSPMRIDQNNAVHILLPMRM
jgi:DNA polymerase-3 subunit beta